MARIMPVMIAGLAMGRMVRQSVSHCVAPSARLPSRIDRGIRASPSSVETMTTGRVMSARVKDAQNSPPVPKVGEGNAASKSSSSRLLPMV